ncbi:MULTISPECIES: alpha/beta hydrolase [Planococcus]|uniref:Carboxylesterase n=1 Tax=Planococcus faecalis TaxID=1598147 RepID=A0ABM6IV71_9BACL|nr:MULTISPECIES: alpha/beta hydrolase [Planococcus]AQU80449.1 carboxylesterase [Planococcus faecalis]MDJ0330250.1 alpha/beta hydrolase [Planococcus sp. S3-L1]OHX54791.1 carboxylesterase [Planococcus faecalis]
MKNIFKQGTNLSKPTLLMLHGTGGNETDLLAIAAHIDPEASVLSVRGNVSENGMPRFFKRLSEGIFDMEDLKIRTEELYNFIGQAADEHGFDRTQVVAIGYSNGANIAANLLFTYTGALKGAILHHPMVPNRHTDLPDLANTPVFIAAGTNDPICPAEESIDLEKLLSDAGAEVELHWENFGHQLTMPEVEAAKNWYDKL